MKTVLITGASSGIGMALAKELAMRGYHLILMARRLDLMQGWTQFIQTQHPDCQITVIASDVANHEQHMTDVAQAIEKAQGLDLVIANAGVGFNTNEWTNTWEGTKKIFDVNLLGAIATIETAKDFFLKQGHGHIVGITSMASVRGMPQVSAYGASKAALSSFLEAMRFDLMGKKITVLDVHPGFVKTPMTEKNGFMPWLQTPQRAAELICRAIENKKSRLYFPWQMLVLNYCARVIPNVLFDFFMRLSRKKVEGFREGRDKGL